MAVVWQLVERTADHAAFTSEGASLVIEAPRPAHADPDLRAAIARLAPHLTFGPAVVSDERVERVAIGEHVVIGRVSRGGWCVAYLVASRGPVDIDDVLAQQFPSATTPFDHLVD